MLTSIGWGTLAVALTEGLSLLRQLDAQALGTAWTCVVSGLLGVFVILVRRDAFALPALKRWHGTAWNSLISQDWLNGLLFALLAVQAAALVTVALSYAPNAFETMRYHLPRVMHWLQDGSLASFPTSNVRENYFPPFAEYVFLHLIALTGGDSYVNLSQIVAFLICLAAVSAIAEQLGAPCNVQIAAAALAAGIPLAVLQATSPRNDLLLALWLLSLVHFGLRWADQPASWLWAAATGLSLGLALLTKATGLTFALPLCIMVGLTVLRTGGLRIGITRALLVVTLGLALNLGHVTRNWALYGSPLGVWGRVGMESTTPATVASTAIRNVALHVPTDCPTPLGFFDAPGDLALQGLEALHSLTGQDPVDSGTSWGTENVFEGGRGCAYDEQEGGNSLHALLIVLTALALPFMRAVTPRAKWLALALVGGFLLLSFFVRWQIWAGYLQLPLFILWTPIVAIALGQIRFAPLARGLALVAVLLSFLWIFNNRLRPLSRIIDGSVPPRDQSYFSYVSMEAFIYPQYRSVAQFIAGTGCQRVGLRIDSPVLEYPFWILLRREGFAGEIQHVDVANELSTYEDARFAPCAVISGDASYDPPPTMREQAIGPFHVYVNLADWP